MEDEEVDTGESEMGGTGVKVLLCFDIFMVIR